MDVELDAIYSTPFKRTLNTARPVAQMHGVKIIETPAESGFMEAMVSQIKAAEAHNILRVKGFAAVEGKPLRLLVQGVGPRVSHHFDRAWNAGEARRGALVVIGLKGFDRAAVEQAILG